MVPPRPLLTAEMLSIGTELTVGETRDTNAGELARSLTSLGVAVRRIQALPDDWGVDPAIRAAINAHSAARSAATSPSSAVVTSVPDQGFAWGDAFIGAAVGVAVMCVALGCVTLLRHDGRLRSA